MQPTHSFNRSISRILLITTLLISISTPSRSEAGIGVIVGGFVAGKSIPSEGLIAILGIGVGGAIIAGGISEISGGTQGVSPRRTALGVGIILLGIDSAQTQIEIENQFINRYSFIDDREVLSELALHTNRKIIEARSKLKNKGDSTLVRFTAEELDRILAPLGITKSEREMIESDLL